MKDVTTFHQGAGGVALRRVRAARAMCLSLAVILSSGILSTGTVTQVARAQFSTETKLTASDASVGSRFGQSVGLSGNTAIIGAHSDDDAAAGAGAAYLFDVGTGNELFKLLASDAAASDSFGWSVAISGNAAIVGAPFDDDAGGGSGSAYLFDVFTGNQLFKPTASDAAERDSFGWSVAINDGMAIVGAPFDDDAGNTSGSAYLFDVGTGSELFKLTASDAAASDSFGWSVAISGNTAIVGALRNNAAYLFDVTTGNELFKLTAGDAAGGESFGGSVAISGNIAIVGAEADSDAGTGSGSAYLYNVATGKELFKLTASDAAAFDKFGISVAISDGVAIVGAEGAADNSGSAYAFDVATGNQILKPTASDTALSDRFGRSVAISGSAALIGANGNDDGAGFESGSAYLFASTSLTSDLTGNGFVDFEDLTVLLANWNQQVGSELGNLVDPTNTPVNFEDLTVLLAGWTGPGPAGAPEAALAAEAVPEPSGLMLAVAGLCGMGCWRRRRART